MHAAHRWGCLLSTGLPWCHDAPRPATHFGESLEGACPQGLHQRVHPLSAGLDAQQAHEQMGPHKICGSQGGTEFRHSAELLTENSPEGHQYGLADCGQLQGEQTAALPGSSAPEPQGRTFIEGRTVAKSRPTHQTGLPEGRCSAQRQCCCTPAPPQWRPAWATPHSQHPAGSLQRNACSRQHLSSHACACSMGSMAESISPSWLGVGQTAHAWALLEPFPTSQVELGLTWHPE